MREPSMSIKEELGNARAQFRLLSLYQRFEHIVITILTALIAIIVVVAVWNLTLKIVFGLILPGNLDPSDYAIFQGVFGMIFTVIIALEFKKSLLVIAERRENVVQIRSVVMIALLAICRKVIILDVKETDALQIFALAAAILALGIVYRLIRDSDQRLVNTALGEFPIADEKRPFFQRGAVCSWQYDVVGGIVQFEGMEGNGDELASKSGKVAEVEHSVDVVIP